MNYKALIQNVFSYRQYRIEPIRLEDRYDIMKWRNEQIYHLRQDRLLTTEGQNNYFNNTVSKLFLIEKPSQLLFSFFENDNFVGYGGLVHINWVDKNAEISFLINTELEKEKFKDYWHNYLMLIEKLAFNELKFHKIYTYAFDLRPHLYTVLEENGYKNEAILKEHCLFDNQFIDVLIHSKCNSYLQLRRATIDDVEQTYLWANDKLVRQFSFNQETISFENHFNWFTNKINSENCGYYILEEKGEAIGSIRFDVFNKIATISYLIDPKQHGKGFGLKILTLGLEVIERSSYDLETVEGFVLPANLASVKIFERLNFEKTILDNNNFRFFKKLNENR